MSAAHQLINTGAGWRCLRCKVAWDQGEDAPETCEAGDEYGFVTDLPPELDQPVLPAAVESVRKGRELARKFHSGGIVPGEQPPQPDLPGERRYPKADMKDQTVKRGMTELAVRLRGETPKLDAVVGFAGIKGSGKDTAASVLIETGYEQVRFADGLKDMLRALLRYRGVSGDMIERYVEGDLKEEPCAALNGRTMRHAMQTLGTDWGRKMIHEDLWADATADQVARRGGRVVVTDVRMPNEAVALRRMGAAIILIDRDTGSEDTHESETSLDQVRTDFVIHNDGSVEDLKNAVREHLIG